ncbi:hypothetical protein EIP86_005436 [Pleurotus ostreatoroseus]|nr:hypothetical protein EIP86_005436 [Pleurotus ostreatoroseus]
MSNLSRFASANGSLAGPRSYANGYHWSATHPVSGPAMFPAVGSSFEEHRYLGSSTGTLPDQVSPSQTNHGFMSPAACLSSVAPVDRMFLDHVGLHDDAETRAFSIHSSVQYTGTSAVSGQASLLSDVVAPSYPSTYANAYPYIEPVESMARAAVHKTPSQDGLLSNTSGPSILDSQSVSTRSRRFHFSAMQRPVPSWAYSRNSSITTPSALQEVYTGPHVTALLHLIGEHPEVVEGDNLTPTQPDVHYQPFVPATPHSPIHSPRTSFPPAPLPHTPSASGTESTPSGRTETSIHDALHAPTLRIKDTAPRNRQVKPWSAPVAPALDEWQCPHCDHYQANGRRPDLQRHIRTHSKDHDKEVNPGIDVYNWICCGVPVEQAANYGIAADTEVKRLRLLGQDRLMVGGCGKSFATRYNYSRHLQAHSSCVGNTYGDWMPGHAKMAKGSR